MKIEQTKKIKTQEEARKFAIDWQNWQSEHKHHYSEMFEWQQKFEELANKFDLVDEFIENGIL